MTDPRAIIELFAFAEGLKNELRHSHTSAGRHESVAEHCWLLCLMALAVFDEISLPVDRMRVLKMLIVHDLPEVITGDIPVFDKAKIAEQAAADEAAALRQIAARYHLGTEIAALCEEFEAQQSNEARLARAIDKAEALMQHNLAPITAWDQNDYDYQTELAHPRNAVFDIDPFIVALKQQIDLDTMTKIDANGMLDRANPQAVAAHQQAKTQE